MHIRRLNVKKSIYSLSVLIVSLFLVACGSDKESNDSESYVGSISVSSQANLSEYPEGVQDGTISPAFYDGVKNYIDTEFITSTGEINEMIREIQNDSNYLSDEENLAKLLKLVQEGKRNLNSIKLIPVTEADQELYGFISEAITHRSVSYNYLIEYCSKNDSTYLRIYKDDYKTLATKYNYILDLVEEFKLENN